MYGPINENFTNDSKNNQTSKEEFSRTVFNSTELISERQSNWQMIKSMHFYIIILNLLR